MSKCQLVSSIIVEAGRYCQWGYGRNSIPCFLFNKLFDLMLLRCRGKGVCLGFLCRTGATALPIGLLRGIGVTALLRISIHTFVYSLYTIVCLVDIVMYCIC